MTARLIFNPRRGHWERTTAPAGRHAHPSHRMHQHSYASHDAIDLGARERQVLAMLKAHGGPMTDRQVCAACGAADLNYARPSVTRLIDAGVLQEVDNVTCETTGRTVRRVWLVEGGVAT